MNISEVFDLWFGLKQEPSWQDSRVAYCYQRSLIGKSDRIPDDLGPESARLTKFNPRWHKVLQFIFR